MLPYWFIPGPLLSCLVCRWNYLLEWRGRCLFLDQMFFLALCISITHIKSVSRSWSNVSILFPLKGAKLLIRRHLARTGSFYLVFSIIKNFLVVPLSMLFFPILFFYVESWYFASRLHRHAYSEYSYTDITYESRHFENCGIHARHGYGYIYTWKHISIHALCITS